MSALTRRQALQAGILGLHLIKAASGQTTDAPWKLLLVVAHPDDEYYFAATVYRIAQELNGIVDQVIITNGEGGYRYSSLAEKIYGVTLTDEATGRSRLPEIRRKEALAAGRILGVRRHYFLNERDARFTLEAGEALGDVWNCGAVRDKLRTLLREERYDFVFTLLPRESTHGHHQAATLLALEIAGELDEEARPVVLGAEPGRAHAAEPFAGLAGFASSRPEAEAPEFTFDRRQSFGYQNALRYDIVVQWVIAEHKSQGMFQNDVGKHDVEHFWRFAVGPKDAARRTHALVRQLRRTASRDAASPSVQQPSNLIRKVAQP
jgi:N-acetylglucosamine malate deacetylase 2